MRAPKDAAKENKDSKGSNGDAMHDANGPAKRKCPDANEDDFVRRSDLDAILGGYTKQNMDANQANIESIGANTGALLRKYDGMLQSRLGKIETDMAEVSNRQDQVELEQRALRSQIEALGKSLAVAVATPPEKMAEADAFSRQVDLSIFRVNTSVLVSKLEVASALAPWMDEAGLQGSDFSLAGPALAKQFVLQFNGEGGLGTRRAKKAGQLLRNGEVWKQFYVTSPAEGEVPLYISMDKNGKQVATERGVKNLRNALLEVHPAKKWTMQKKDGSIQLDWMPIARCRPQEDGHLLVEWNGLQVAKEEINKEEVMRIFRSTGRAPVVSSICWSV